MSGERLQDDVELADLVSNEFHKSLGTETAPRSPLTVTGPWVSPWENLMQRLERDKQAVFLSAMDGCAVL